jgi:hypothetical protein
MADDFFNNDQADDTADDQQGEVQDEPQKVSIGDEEYSLEEAQRLVSLGKIGVEAEEKFNTKLDKVWPEFSKTKNDYKELEKRMEELEGSKAEVGDTAEAGAGTDIEQAKRLLKEWGFVSEKDVQGLWKQYDAGKEFLAKANSLESKYDGSDGRPKADAQNILEYMRDTGIQDPETAYKVKYEDELDKWRETKLGQAKKSGLTTESAATTGKAPERKSINIGNLGAAIAESLNTGG